MPVQINSISRSLPIKALKCENSELFYATGTFVGKNEDGESSTETKLDEKLNIHGLSFHENSSSNQFIAFGGNLAHILTNGPKIKISGQIQLEKQNWIKNAKILKIDENFEILEVAVLTFFNKIFIFSRTESRSDSNEFTKIACFTAKTKCILYSSDLLFVSATNRLQILSGNVFNFITFWDIDLSKENVQEHSDPVPEKTFNGHKGAIFNLKFLPNKNNQQFLSCSDDRSIRIWDIQTNSCLSQLYGHTARIWDAIYLEKKNLIVSCSEDQTLIVWDVNDYSCPKILVKFVAHFGRNVWCLLVWAGFLENFCQEEN